MLSAVVSSKAQKNLFFFFQTNINILSRNRCGGLHKCAVSYSFGKFNVKNLIRSESSRKPERTGNENNVNGFFENERWRCIYPERLTPTLQLDRTRVDIIFVWQRYKTYETNNIDFSIGHAT